MNADSPGSRDTNEKTARHRQAGAADAAFDLARVVRDYGDIDEEVAACRHEAALFDFSFIRAARVSGPAALQVLARLTDRRLDDLRPGRIRYALCRDESRYLRSDLTVWNEDGGGYLVMSGLRQDVADLVAAAESTGPATSVEDLGDTTVVYAVQGPSSLRILDGLADVSRLATLPYFGFANSEIAGVRCRVGRLGYTGERGFEIVAPSEAGASLWERLSARVRPAGFAAADCLRIEAGFVLFANEFRLPVTATEVSLKAFAAGDPARPRVRLVSFRAETGTAPILWSPPEGIALPAPGTITVTSACRSAIAGGVLGLGFVVADEPGFDRPFTDPWGRFHRVRTVPRPFYDTAKRRPRGGWH